MFFWAEGLLKIYPHKLAVRYACKLYSQTSQTPQCGVIMGMLLLFNLGINFHIVLLSNYLLPKWIFFQSHFYWLKRKNKYTYTHPRETTTKTKYETENKRLNFSDNKKHKINKQNNGKKILSLPSKKILLMIGSALFSSNPTCVLLQLLGRVKDGRIWLLLGRNGFDL